MSLSYCRANELVNKRIVEDEDWYAGPRAFICRRTKPARMPYGLLHATTNRQTGKHGFRMFQITHRVPIILCRKLELLAHGPKVGQQFNAFKHLRNALHQQVVPKCMLSHSV